MKLMSFPCITDHTVEALSQELEFLRKVLAQRDRELASAVSRIDERTAEGKGINITWLNIMLACVDFSSSTATELCNMSGLRSQTESVVKIVLFRCIVLVRYRVVQFKIWAQEQDKSMW